MRQLKKSFSFVFLLASTQVFSQKVQQVTANVVSANEVHIFYELSETKHKELYDISVYASNDNFSKKLTHLSGNVGKNTSPGSSQKIIWNPQKNLSDFDGDIVFEVRAKAQTKKKIRTRYVLIPLAVIGVGISTIVLLNQVEIDD
jgi:hypothetical protein